MSSSKPVYPSDLSCIGELLVPTDVVASLQQLLQQQGQRVAGEQIAHAVVEMTAMQEWVGHQIPQLAEQAGLADCGYWQSLSRLQAAQLLLNHLTGKNRRWLVAEPQFGLVAELWQWLTATGSPLRRRRYPNDLAGWQKLQQEFGSDSSKRVGPGPWLSPELVQIEHISYGAVQQASFRAHNGELLWVLPAVAASQAQQQLEAAAVGQLSGAAACVIFCLPDDCGYHCDECATTEVQHWLRPQQDLLSLAAALLQLEQDSVNGPRVVVLEPAAVDLAEPAGTAAEDAGVLQTLPLWRDKLPRIPFLQPLVTINRPLPHRRQGGELSQPMANYLIELAEVNPGLRTQLAASHLVMNDGACSEHIPSSNPQDLSEGIALLAEQPELLWNACLGNQQGINLLLLQQQQLQSLSPAIQSLARDQQPMRANQDMPVWASWPLAGLYDQTLDDVWADLLVPPAGFHTLYSPDMTTTLGLLRSCYGDNGSIYLSAIPLREPSNPLSQLQSDLLIKQGAVCLAGEPHQPVQLVACGSTSLDVAWQLSRRLNADDVPHSLVYVLEPARFMPLADHADLPEQGEQDDDDWLEQPQMSNKGFDGYFSADQRGRLIIADFDPTRVGQPVGCKKHVESEVCRCHQGYLKGRWVAAREVLAELDFWAAPSNW
ncbi:hypothetical protein [Oceanobacter mangrovi]|uniref:hypothetical protein n=1 Tax=Oceanobacter mangrovi TaxID=2862510 RepID=UPI001C8EEABE|nr:hypothetical protein [Oceanobacter mangrovi]